VNDDPYANWDHPCRYIFVDAKSGTNTIITDRPIYPLGLSEEFEAISLATPADTCNPQQPPPVQINGLAPNPHLYAVIIGGIEDPLIVNQPFCWNDISAVYTTLEKVYGYKPANMFVHFFHGTSMCGKDLDGDGINDIDYAAYKDTIHHTFNCLAGSETDPLIPKLKPDDQLFVYVDDHGGCCYSGFSYIYLPRHSPYNPLLADSNLRSDELALWVKNIQCGQMIFFFEQCNSGGFVNTLKDSYDTTIKCKNRSIYTSAAYNEEEKMEYHISNQNYGEFAFYWTAAVRGYFPDIHGYRPWMTGFPVYDPKDTSGFPYNSCFATCLNHRYYNPDSTRDGVITMEEAFTYANDYDSWSDTAFWCPEYPWPNIHPQRYKNISFKEDLQSLSGLTGIITKKDTLDKRSYIIGGPLKVINDATVTFHDYSHVYFIEPGNLDVQIEASIKPGKNMSFEGNSNNSIIIIGVLGSLIGDTIGNNHYDTSSGYFGGLIIENPYLSTSMKNVLFRNTAFRQAQGKSLKIKNSDFKDCDYFISFADSISISKTDFDNTFIYLGDVGYGQSSIAVIDTCTFNTSNNLYGADMIDVNDFDHFYIHDNTIDSADFAGIGLYDCGHGTSGNKNVFNNTITNCNTGINVYLSNGIVQNNYISNNDIGARFINRSNTQLIGNPNAGDSSETQRIYNNDSFEVYASDQSLPYEFHYNFIVDEDNGGNPTDPLLYNENSYQPPYIKIDIENNCWGHSFDPLEDLYTNYGIFKFGGIWCPGPGYKDQLIPGPDENMFNTADSLFSKGNYTSAKLLFESLIGQYPDSKFAEAAMKNLFSLEQFAGNDYAGLKQYYLTSDSIIADTNLEKLGEFLANRCDVEMQNWPQTIDWYENRILNPPSDADSICAIIDLEAVYLLMANDSTKSSYIGKLPQYKPTTVVHYRFYRDSLIALLPFKHKHKPLVDPMAKLNANTLLQNNPNPYSEKTDIWYNLGKNCNRAIIVITDYMGKICEKIELSDISEGTHKITIDASGLSPGIYLYSLEVNGRKTDTRKMVVIH